MSESKHTPGPLCVAASQDPLPPSLPWEIHVPLGEATAFCRYEADARLYAVAPKMFALLKRYREETPLGHQPHMIAHEVDEVIAMAEGRS